MITDYEMTKKLITIHGTPVWIALAEAQYFLGPIQQEFVR